jgi:hypothetical protein
MADRVNINPSTEGGGPDVLTDTITNLNAASLSPSAEAQRAKIGFGGDAVFIDVSAATPLPVTGTQLTTLHTDLAALLTELAQKLEPSDLNLLATAAKQDVAHTDLGAILAKLSADPATQTTLASILAKLTTTAGAPLAIRVSDGTAYLTLATVSDRLKVDVGGSLPAGTNNIGDVDVLTLPSIPAGSNAIGRLADGTFGYAAGTAAGNVDVPTGARIKRVSVIAGAAAGATVTILGGNTITIPAGGAFDEQVPGDATATSATNEVVVGGTIQSYYVAWVS